MAGSRRYSGARGQSPPHISFGRFKATIGELEKNTVPELIDESVWPSLGIQARNEILACFAFLKLVDSDNASTPQLRRLVAAFGDGHWSRTLADVLRDAYPSLVCDELATMTSRQFDDAFEVIYPGQEAVRKKCVTFFLGAAADAGIKVSPRVEQRRRPRKDRGASPRFLSAPPKRKILTRSDPHQSSVGIFAGEVEGHRSAIFAELIGDVSTLSEAEEDACWTMFAYFKRLDLARR